MRGRYGQGMANQNEKYVLGLCDEVLGSTGLRQHRFEWLEGDPSPNTGRRMTLPVDAYWPDHAPVVEFHEKQHTEQVRHFDKPDVMTVSGMHRACSGSVTTTVVASWFQRTGSGS